MVIVTGRILQLDSYFTYEFSNLFQTLQGDEILNSLRCLRAEVEKQLTVVEQRLQEAFMDPNLILNLILFGSFYLVLIHLPGSLCEGKVVLSNGFPQLIN